MSRISTISFTLITLIAMLLSSCSKPPNDKLNIATAANVQFAMEELTDSFTKASGIPCEIIIGSSGKLMAQIREGAPFHVFVSADMKYPNTLFVDGLTTAKPDVYAQGTLVLWSLQDQVPSLDALRESSGKIAMANPDIAPYGRAARESLQKYGLYDEFADRLIFGESIAQTNQFILSGAVDAGFTAKSVVVSPKIKDQGTWTEIPDDSYAPIEQGVVVIRTGDGMEEKAEKFRQFLLSDEARSILEEYGYKTSARP